VQFAHARVTSISDASIKTPPRATAAPIVALMWNYIVAHWRGRLGLLRSALLFAAAVFTFLVDAIPAHGEDLSRREALELQRECSLQAQRVFKSGGWDSASGNIANFESHYNSTMNKCFMVVRVLTTSPAKGSKSWASTFLLDAYDQRSYAELNILDFPWVGDPVGHKHIATCALMPPHDSQRTCQSEAEFASFAAQYMEATVTTQDTLVDPDR
jgi:hypothetical protein